MVGSNSKLGGLAVKVTMAAMSARRGFIGERAGLFPQHEWQNRLRGEANDADANNYFNSEKAVIDRVKRALTRGEPVDLSWDMELLPGANPGVPSGLELGY
jgi:hypothetical protein